MGYQHEPSCPVIRVPARTSHGATGATFRAVRWDSASSCAVWLGAEGRRRDLLLHADGLLELYAFEELDVVTGSGVGGARRSTPTSSKRQTTTLSAPRSRPSCPAGRAAALPEMAQFHAAIVLASGFGPGSSKREPSHTPRPEHPKAG
jgi:hypothetical protein